MEKPSNKTPEWISITVTVDGGADSRALIEVADIDRVVDDGDGCILYIDRWFIRGGEVNAIPIKESIDEIARKLGAV